MHVLIIINYYNYILFRIQIDDTGVESPPQKATLDYRRKSILLSISSDSTGSLHGESQLERKISTASTDSGYISRSGSFDSQTEQSRLQSGDLCQNSDRRQLKKAPSTKNHLSTTYNLQPRAPSPLLKKQQNTN